MIADCAFPFWAICGVVDSKSDESKRVQGPSALLLLEGPERHFSGSAYSGLSLFALRNGSLLDKPGFLHETFKYEAGSTVEPHQAGILNGQFLASETRWSLSRNQAK